MNTGLRLAGILAILVMLTISATVRSALNAAEQQPAKTESQDPPEKRTPGKDGEKNSAAHGIVIGTVVAKGDSWVQLKSISGHLEKYIPEWEGGAPQNGGGPKKDVVRQIALLKVGDRVAAEWYVNDHLRLKSIRVIKE